MSLVVVGLLASAPAALLPFPLSALQLALPAPRYLSPSQSPVPSPWISLQLPSVLSLQLLPSPDLQLPSVSSLQLQLSPFPALILVVLFLVRSLFLAV